MEPPPNPNPKPIPAVLLPLTFGVLNPNPLLKSPPKADTREYSDMKAQKLLYLATPDTNVQDHTPVLGRDITIT